MSFWQNLWNFLVGLFNSSFFTSLATIGTIGGAILVFKKQKQSEKQQIARLLVEEIRNAEQSLKLLRERGEGSEIPPISILTQNSWARFSFLFTNDLDQDDIQTINEFYASAERANVLVEEGNSLRIFLRQVNSKSDAIQHALVNLISTEITPADTKVRSDAFKRELDSNSGTSNYHYSASGYVTKLDIYLNKIKDILSTSAGMKLKQIAGYKK